MTEMKKTIAEVKAADAELSLLKKSCSAFVGWIIGTLWVAWMVMFAAALIGFPIAYLTALLLTYTATAILNLGRIMGDTIK